MSTQEDTYTTGLAKIVDFESLTTPLLSTIEAHIKEMTRFTGTDKCEVYGPSNPPPGYFLMATAA